MSKATRFLVGACLFGGAILFHGCGGGGGSGGADTDPPPENPLTDNYIYELRGLPSALSETDGMRVTATFAIDGEQHPLSMGLNPYSIGDYVGFAGTVDPDTGEVTVSADSICEVYDLDLFESLLDLKLRVETDIHYPANAPITSGSIRVEADDGAPLARVTFGQAENGVLVEYDWDGAQFTVATPFSYSDFTTLWNADDNNYVQLSRFSHKAIGFLMRQVYLVQYALVLIGENEDDLLAGPYADTGDSLSGLTLPPEIPSPANAFTVTWYDDNANDQLGPGDSFSLSCHQVYLNTADGIDFFFDGAVDFTGFVDTVSGEITERIGFEPFGEDPGGVFLDDFTESAILEEGSTLSVFAEYTLNGAFSLVVYPEGL